MTDFNGPVRENFRRDKDVRCSWCNEWIKAGDLYRHFFQRYQGEGQQIRFHIECDDDGYKAMDWDLVDGEFQLGEMERGKPVESDYPLSWLGKEPEEAGLA
jgi:hypothetical protein